MNAGDVLLLLTAIESNARTARESLANSLILQNQPDPLAMPGQPQRPPNKAIAATLMQQHVQAKSQMLAVTAALINGEQQAKASDDTSPIAGRIGERLNGTGGHTPHGA